MRKASVRDQEAEEIQITGRKRVLARLVPERVTVPLACRLSPHGLRKSTERGSWR